MRYPQQGTLISYGVEFFKLGLRPVKSIISGDALQSACRGVSSLTSSLLSSALRLRNPEIVERPFHPALGIGAHNLHTEPNMAELPFPVRKFYGSILIGAADPHRF